MPFKMEFVSLFTGIAIIGAIITGLLLLFLVGPILLGGLMILLVGRSKMRLAEQISKRQLLFMQQVFRPDLNNQQVFRPEMSQMDMDQQMRDQDRYR
jgi:hypothetical protein